MMTSQQHPDWCLTKQLDRIIYPSWRVKLAITIELMKPRLLCLIYNMWCPVLARPDAGKDWRQEEKRDDRGWDGLMALTARWTWVWASSRSWWWIGKPGVLQSMDSQRIRHNWVTELNWSLKRNKIHAMPCYAQSLQMCLTLCNLWTVAR